MGGDRQQWFWAAAGGQLRVRRSTPLSLTHTFIPSGPAGQCQDDIPQFCEDVEPGEGRLAACLSKQLWKESRGEGDDDGEASLLRDRSSAQHEEWNKYASEM